MHIQVAKAAISHFKGCGFTASTSRRVWISPFGAEVYPRRSIRNPLNLLEADAAGEGGGPFK